MSLFRAALLVCLCAGLLGACSGSPAPGATPPPAGSLPGAPLTYAEIKDLQLCQLVSGCIPFTDGRYTDTANNTSSVLLESPLASGDLNGDGWPDAAVIVQESYDNTGTTELVALLNLQGQPVEAAGVVLGQGDLSIKALQIENGQIRVTASAPSPASDPHYAITEAVTTYQLREESLALMQLATTAQDGTQRQVEILPGSGSSVTSSPYIITLRLITPPYAGEMTYNIYDASGANLYQGSSPVTQSGQAEYQLPIDLSWTRPGQLQILVKDFYTSPDTVLDLALNTQTIDYQPAEQAVRPGMFAPGSFQMLDASHGWAQSAASGQLLRTNDGGHTWQASPLSGNGTLVLSALDPANAIAGLLPFDPDSPTASATLQRTSDGGQTWAPLPAVTVTAGGSLLSFLDPQVGFLENHPEGVWMMGQTVFQLYRTLDGGQTWEKTFDNTTDGPQAGQEPGRGYMVFRDRDNGWALDATIGMTAPDTLYLMRTRDGGRTWQNQELPRPETPAESYLSQQSLTFFGPQMAVMPLVIVPPSGDSSLRLYLSADGGETWQLTQPLTIQTPNPVIFPLSAATVLVQDGDKLYRTEDGGMTWVEQPFQPPAPGALAGLQFITPQLAFALVNDHNPDAYNTDLYTTNDGGATWQHILPQLP